MSVHEFAFTLRLSDRAQDDAMLIDVTRRVLGQMGYRDQAIDELVEVVGDAFRAGGDHAPCAIRFLAGAGELRIAVTIGAREWHTTRPLP